MAVLRQGVRENARLRIDYVDAVGAGTNREVWPLALLFYPDVTLLGAWCEIRGAYRFFRTDRIERVEPTGERFDSRNGALLEALMTGHCSEF